MQITTKFSPGDTVWLIVDDRELVFVTCAFCAGEGNIKGANQQSVLCPECYGKTGKTEYRDTKWLLRLEAMTVGRVEVRITDSPGVVGEELYTNYQA